ncbi:hypothetical protein HY496_01260 [Candidatus Woesearchaeota archaeon]|nr:hypothetical protein [Candidatus Woesearchaeota archaeon]
MTQDLQKDERYWKNVAKINRYVGCSHHPQDALDAVVCNEWSEGIAPDYSSDRLGIFSREELGLASPRQRFAYDTFSWWFALTSGLAYFGGRCIRNGFSAPEGTAPLDMLVDNAASDCCLDICVKKAYEIEYPFSATAEKIMGGVAGATLAPLAFTVGLVYTPKGNAR